MLAAFFLPCRVSQFMNRIATQHDAVVPVTPPPTEELPSIDAVLLDLIDLQTLQTIQDGFVDVTGLRVTVRDQAGEPLTETTDPEKRKASSAMLDMLLTDHDLTQGGTAAPILVAGKVIGTINIEQANGEKPTAAAVQFMLFLADGIARMCNQERLLAQRIDELTALYRMARVLAAHQDLQQVLDTAAREAAQVLGVKAVSIRLQGDRKNEFIPRAVHNLSDKYLRESTMLAHDCRMFEGALNGEVVVIEDMWLDERVQNPDSAKREGLRSMIAAGLIYQERGLGVIQLFTENPHRFKKFEINLVKAMSRLLAAAIESSRLESERRETRTFQRQMQLAGDVQRRMLPGAMPHVPPLDLAARYVPSLELGGDFYDFIDLEGHLGIVIGDVVGKGVPAALLMASVRASLRAYAQDLYDIDEILHRVNLAMTRDTLDREFATLFYSVIDPKSLRMTYCNAGHDPPMLLRDGKLQSLETGGMIVGIDHRAHYEKGVVALKPGDHLLLYTDGLQDAMNFEDQKFGKDRIIKAFREGATMTSARDALNHIVWEMRRFTGIRSATDDTTVVVVRVGDPANP